MLDRNQINNRIAQIVEQRRPVLIECPAVTTVESVLAHMTRELQEHMDATVEAALAEGAGS